MRKVLDRLHLTRMGIRAKFSILFYLVTLASVSVIGWYGYIHASDAYRGKAAEVDAGYTLEVAQRIENFLHRVPDDLNFLSEYYALARYLYWGDLGHEAKATYWEAVTRDTFRSFVASRDYYYKARFMDDDGRERIKARYDRATGTVRFETGEELQEKRHYDYFRKAMVLEKGRLHVSPLDLNREHGKIEKPYTPVIRYAQPVVGANNVKYGALVLNVYADAFLDFIREAGEERRAFYLVDQQGEYLYHADPEHAFGHLLGHATSFREEFERLFGRIQGGEEGTLFDEGLIVSYKRIHPNPADPGYYWTLVGVVDEEVALSNLRDFKFVFIALLLVVLVLVFAASRYYVGGLVRPLLGVTSQLQRLGRGEVVAERIDYAPRDEIRQMLDSTDRLLRNMERLADRADAIAQGEFSGEVELLSEGDRLGGAINNMTRMLREGREQDSRQNWLKDGVGQLSHALSGDLGPRELADKAVSVVGRYLDVGRGVLYVLSHDESRLDLLGSYMYTERETLGNHFKLGEGAVGQVAVERKPIELVHIEEGVAPITTGTTSHVPHYTFTLPLIRDEVLYGVIELAAMEPFDELQREFINGASEVIASFLFAVLQREKIRNLLAETEESARQAREQSERLQEANTQMEEQQQQLQQQAEELQEANAQMEEQQQQLQQQTEELQQANAQMEEQQQQLQQQTRELERRNRELVASQSDLDQKARELELASKYKSEFLANMSHELRTPLNSIILLSKMLTMNNAKHLDGEEVKRASVIHNAGEELLRLINDILDLSKIEAGKMELHLAPLHSLELAREFQDLFSETAREQGLEFRCEDSFDGEFTTDRDKLAQIIRNLLSNAFKFTKQGVITLRVERSDNPHLPVRVAVIDSGIGIPVEKQRLIFEAFQQADGSTSREYGGTGLGLSISMRFAQLLGGTIELSSSHGQGSEFAVLLPLVVEAAGSVVAPLHEPLNLPHAPAKPFVAPGAESASAPLVEATARIPAPSSAAEVPITTGARIMVGEKEVEEVHDDRANLKSSDSPVLMIDDDAAFAGAVRDLNRKLGYKTLIALTGREGLRMAKTYHPKGILLDLGLPDMDGSEVLSELKANRELRQIPVYIVSARDKDAGLLAKGIAGYLRKPVDDTQLADAEAAILALGGAEGKRILVVEGTGLRADAVADLVGERGVAVEGVEGGAAAMARLEQGVCDLVIVDLALMDDAECRRFCPALRERFPRLPLMLYGEQGVDGDQEARLREYTDSIILKTPNAERRMLENIERFLKGVPDGESASTGGAIPPTEEEGRRLDGRRILVVDDDPRNLFVITSALESQGAAVSTALNGRKALEKLEEKRLPDLIFMDIMMPEMDGYETIRALRDDARLKALPVVALTAKALKADKEKALAAGADDYLAKPVDYEVLVNMARVWCEERR